MNWKPLILLLSLSTSALAVEDPPNCDLSHGGLGNTSSGAIGWSLSQAHVGDVVSVVPRFGMVTGACSADSVTGSVYIATGFLTNFLINTHSYPTGATVCPVGVQCTPGPYNVTITAPLVGAGVTSPYGTIGGLAKAVRVVENASGLVNTIVGADATDFHSSSLSIVTPCIQVFETCGVSCVGSNVTFTGYVTNCGDINLTNVFVTDDRTTLVNANGSSLSQPFNLNINSIVEFKGSFSPFGSETSTATNTATARGTDTTAIGGPSASVTNSVTSICTVVTCNACECPCTYSYEPIPRWKRYAMK